VRQSGANNSGELQTFLGVGYHIPHYTNDVSADLFSVSQSFLLFGLVGKCYKHIQYFFCVGVMYKGEESHIRKLIEESNVEFGYESDLLSDRQSDCF
jgi:hypothetical protein